VVAADRERDAIGRFELKPNYHTLGPRFGIPKVADDLRAARRWPARSSTRSRTPARGRASAAPEALSDSLDSTVAATSAAANRNWRELS
jgi:hypothetical protein